MILILCVFISLKSVHAVVDQSVREVCLLKECQLDVNRGFLELLSGLEGCDARFVS